MKKFWQVWMGVAALLVAGSAAAQQTAKEAGPMGDASVYDKFLRPGDNHKILERFVGTWKGDLKALLHGTPPKEVPMQETLEARWILDGRFLETQFTFQINGEKIQGETIMGFNGGNQKFTRLYISAVDVRETFSHGVYIRAKDTLVFRGLEHDPVTGDDFERRDVYLFGPDKNKIGYERIYNMADGSDIKVVEGTYTRVTEPAAPKK